MLGPGQPVPPVAWDVAKGLLSFWGKQGRMILGIVHLEGRPDQQPSYAVVLFLAWLRARMGCSASQALAGEAGKIRGVSTLSCLLHSSVALISAVLISAVSIRGTVSSEG